MPTEPAHVIAARANAQARPLATAGAHLRHLVNAIRYTDEHAATHGGHLTIKTEEAEAVAAVVLDLAAKPATPVYLAVYIGTTNDTNGDPRRGWYVSRIDGKPVQGADYTAWIEEGYGNFPWGVFAVRLGLSVAPETPGRPWYEARDAASPYVRMTGRINVTPGEYRDARKLPRFGGAA